MRAPGKVGLVAAGYVGAAVAAAAVVGLRVASTSGADRQSYGGMYAFGDTLLFLAAFGVAAVPATVLGLFFLRPYPAFWRALAVSGLVVAWSAIAALAVYLAAQHADAGPRLHYWSMFAVLRILASPLFALAFLLSVFLAPGRWPRIALIVSTLAESVVCLYVALVWFGGLGSR